MQYLDDPFLRPNGASRDNAHPAPLSAPSTDPFVNSSHALHDPFVESNGRGQDFGASPNNAGAAPKGSSRSARSQSGDSLPEGSGHGAAPARRDPFAAAAHGGASPVEQKVHELQRLFSALEAQLERRADMVDVGVCYKRLEGWTKAHRNDPDLPYVMDKLGTIGGYPEAKRRDLQDQYERFRDSMAQKHGEQANLILPLPPRRKGDDAWSSWLPAVPAVFSFGGDSADVQSPPRRRGCCAAPAHYIYDAFIGKDFWESEDGDSQEEAAPADLDESLVYVDHLPGATLSSVLSLMKAEPWLWEQVLHQHHKANHFQSTTWMDDVHAPGASIRSTGFEMPLPSALPQLVSSSGSTMNAKVTFSLRCTAGQLQLYTQMCYLDVSQLESCRIRETFVCCEDQKEAGLSLWSGCEVDWVELSSKTNSVLKAAIERKADADARSEARLFASLLVDAIRRN